MLGDVLENLKLDFEVTKEKNDIDFNFILVPLRNRYQQTRSSMVLQTQVSIQQLTAGWFAVQDVLVLLPYKSLLPSTGTVARSLYEVSFYQGSPCQALLISELPNRRTSQTCKVSGKDRI